ncbi:hypothetical protein Nwi_0175 [Nitrobacter winogradskyi Nb-255]|uniref:Uncharacterized protein n=1 Tax=Nitrobacter winogradskyi (strain ATCC 25391 / DSM 10237 / CIP 104748 / NCIMB 11846 / Nb-255) TaxID=323098 RepID=Q3SW98_NITWN|nr:hypothetical protein [Nitrobacter winogradskyi]ABA03443.1 hypothetical protein Nwi_0175 [Nitrobacter winogradskyi Nb-255]
MLKTSLIAVAAAGFLLALPASAADFSFTDEAPQMICDHDGNCYSAHPPRFAERWQDDDNGDDVYERRDYHSRYAPPSEFHRDDDGPATGYDGGPW